MTNDYSNGNGPGVLLELCAKLDAHITAVHDLSKELRKPPPKPKKPQQPSFIRVRGSATATAAGLAIITFDLKGPDQGHWWAVRSIVIGGSTVSTSAMGTADVFVTAMSGPTTTIANMGLADWRDHAATLPDVSFYGRGELPLRLNEELLVIVSGGTSGQQYVAAAQVEDYEEAADIQTWSL